MSDKMLSKDDFQTTLDIQSACNLSGVVHSFSRIISKIWNEANAHGKGTEWVNKHPICVLFAEQIIYLSTGQSSNNGNSYNKAHDFCDVQSKGHGEKAIFIHPEYAYPIIGE